MVGVFTGKLLCKLAYFQLQGKDPETKLVSDMVAVFPALKDLCQRKYNIYFLELFISQTISVYAP